jgi:hypothetical protein
VCGVCGRVGRLAVRATDTSPAVGDCCYRPPVATCSRCGREQPCYHAGDPQRAICLACASRRTTIVTCLDCEKPRAAHRRVEGGAICETCDRRRGNTIGVCTGCGQRAPLRRERCDRCLLRAAVEELADTGDPAAVAALLAPLLEWMATARNPASMLRWMQTPTFWVTRDLINGVIEVSHAGLDAVAPRAPQVVGFVRAQLVGCGVLPARVAMRVGVVKGTGQQALSDVARVGAHRYDEHELGIAGRAVGQVVGEQKALARARGDDAPAVGDRLNIHRCVIGANRTILAPPISRGPGRGARAPPPASATHSQPTTQSPSRAITSSRTLRPRQRPPAMPSQTLPPRRLCRRSPARPQHASPETSKSAPTQLHQRMLWR